MPEEMPPSWPLAALEAQAVAVRSMALSLIAAQPAEAPSTCYSDGRSQVYGGIPAETSRTTEAAFATRGRVVLYDGRLATTYYSSSTGGMTTAVDDGTGKPIPYLVSVPDPWDTPLARPRLGPDAPQRRGRRRGRSGSGGPLGGLVVSPVAGHVASALALGPGDDQVTLTGAPDRGRSRASLHVLPGRDARPRRRSPSSVAPGTAVTLTGTVRGFPGASLESEAARRRVDDRRGRDAGQDRRVLGPGVPEGNHGIPPARSPPPPAR